MKKSISIILISLASIVVVGIFLAIAGFAYFYYTGNLDHNPERPKGEAFGPSTDQQGCVDESLRRIREYPESTFSERIEKAHISSFTSGCFSTCKPSKDFCVGVPKVKEVIDSLEFVEHQCNRVGLDRGACTNVFRRVIKECSNHKLTVVSYPDDDRKR